MLPKVTVITATYNLVKEGRLDFFRQCVESVHNQTYQNIEHIIADGASSDGTLDVIEEYVRKGWVRCISKPDAGIDDGYNHGLKISTGKYVFFMNSDDYYYSSDAIEACVDSLEKNDADFCYGSELKIDRSGKKVFYWKPTPEIFWHDMPFSHQTMGVKCDVLTKLGGYRTDCGFGGDYQLVIDLFLGNYKGCQVDKTISCYRVGGISSQTEDKAQQMRVVYVLAKRIKDFSDLFYTPKISIDQAVNIYFQARTNPVVFPPYYLQKMVRYIAELKLTNFDFNSFLDYVNKVSTVSGYSTCTKKRYFLFNIIPFLKIKKVNGVSYYYLFGFVPILKIKG